MFSDDLIQYADEVEERNDELCNTAFDIFNLEKYESSDEESNFELENLNDGEENLSDEERIRITPVSDLNTNSFSKILETYIEDISSIERRTEFITMINEFRSKYES